MMAEAGADWLFIPHSTDLRYLIGYAHRQSERLTLLLIPAEGRPYLLLPSFEMPVVEKYATYFDLLGWEENESPVGKIGKVVGEQGIGKTVLIGDPLHALFLLRIQDELSQARFKPGSLVMAKLRMLKTPDEIALLRRTGRSADQALQALLEQPLREMTEKDVLRFLHTALLADGHESVGTGIVGGGPNSASPHYRTGDRRLQRGDALVIDFGGSYKGYRSDTTRTFHIGEPSEDFKKTYQIVKDAQQLAFEAVRPGMRAEEIDLIARSYIADHGFGEFFLHRTGHGIGMDGHEPPYLVEGDKTKLEEGFTFSIEPGIYLAGRYGIRIEDIVAISNGAGERLNNFSRDLQVIPT